MLPKLGLSAFLLLALGSCTTKEDAAQPTTAYTGTVQLHDETGTLLTDHSGVKVSLYDDPNVSTLTAANGSFTLVGVAAGPHRLVMEKQIPGRHFGTYFTDEISTTSQVYTLPRPVALGLAQTDTYYISHVVDPQNSRLIIRGQRIPATSFPTQSLYHRIYLDNSFIASGLAVLSLFKYSRMHRNNLPSGFADTISYATLAMHNITAGANLLAISDNPKADSCLAPYPSPVPGDNRIKFALRYPADGYTDQSPMLISLY
jgi:hypothetical protein